MALALYGILFYVGFGLFCKAVVGLNRLGSRLFERPHG